MVSVLSGKNVIFFCPRYFGYEKRITRELEQLGAEVTFHGQLPNEHPWIKAMFRIFPKSSWRYSDRYFFSWLKNCAPVKCDIVFVIKGEGLSPSFLRTMKKKYPDAKFILHLWDSIKNCSHINLKLPYFDSFSSFDPDDCERLNQFRYRPLFFIEEYLNREPQKSSQGLFSIGTLNKYRANIILKLEKALEETTRFKYWLYVRSRQEFNLGKLFNNCLRSLDKSHLIFKPMTTEEIIQHLNECDAVVDIEHPNQSGLTIRTFEVIASGKKLITTNQSIVGHEFFDPARICVIDRKDPRIPDDFLSKPTPSLSEDFIRRYSLRGWLLDIIDV